jgi:MFS family permease
MPPTLTRASLRRWTPIPVGLTPRERSLLRLHLLSSIFSGGLMGCINLADATLAKTLHGSALQVTLLSLLAGLSYIAALFWGSAIRGRRKAPFLLLFGVVGRLGLALVGLSPDPNWFLFVFALVWIADSLVVTAQVSIIRRAYAPEHRNTLFGLTISATTLVRLVTSVALGSLLDWNEGAYGVYYAIGGLCGFIGIWWLMRMERALDAVDGPDAPIETPPSGVMRGDPVADAYRPMGQPGLAATLRSMRESIALVTRIVREDAPFRRFERNFFIYGIAFLSLTPVTPLFLVNDLLLDYTHIGIAKGLMGQAGMILFPPILGRTMGRLGPVRFCVGTFAFLALYPLLLFVASVAPGGAALPAVYAAFGCFGIGMAGVSLAWHMSSIHFARDEDPSSYQAVHSVLTGVRGGFAPLLGYGFIEAGSKRLAFLFSALMLLAASGFMARLARTGAAQVTPLPPRKPD